MTRIWYINNALDETSTVRLNIYCTHRWVLCMQASYIHVSLSRPNSHLVKFSHYILCSHISTYRYISDNSSFSGGVSVLPELDNGSDHFFASALGLQDPCPSLKRAVLRLSLIEWWKHCKDHWYLHIFSSKGWLHICCINHIPWLLPFLGDSKGCPSASYTNEFLHCGSIDRIWKSKLTIVRLSAWHDSQIQQINNFRDPHLPNEFTQLDPVDLQAGWIHGQPVIFFDVDWLGTTKPCHLRLCNFSNQQANWPLNIPGHHSNVLSTPLVLS